jgi:hypothetical protein
LRFSWALARRGQNDASCFFFSFTQQIIL